ncbi:hypothetical protein lerEdw1_017591 [Lerista edwardsae]|nr:hypothetical protein lerEdw1_017591 [Lerista edwardsae]
MCYQMTLTPHTEADVPDGPGAAAMTISPEQCILFRHSDSNSCRSVLKFLFSLTLTLSALFRNTNLEDVMNARKLEREHLRDESQRKKDQDKLQREKDKLSKQERKEKERKRTQKGERKR